MHQNYPKLVCRPYSCFEKVCPTKAYKLARQCRKVFWWCWFPVAWLKLKVFQCDSRETAQKHGFMLPPLFLLKHYELQPSNDMPSLLYLHYQLALSRTLLCRFMGPLSTQLCTSEYACQNNPKFVCLPYIETTLISFYQHHPPYVTPLSTRHGFLPRSLQSHLTSQ